MSIRIHVADRRARWRVSPAIVLDVAPLALAGGATRTRIKAKAAIAYPAHETQDTRLVTAALAPPPTGVAEPRRNGGYWLEDVAWR